MNKMETNSIFRERTQEPSFGIPDNVLNEKYNKQSLRANKSVFNKKNYLTVIFLCVILIANADEVIMGSVTTRFINYTPTTFDYTYYATASGHLKTEKGVILGSISGVPNSVSEQTLLSKDKLPQFIEMLILEDNKSTIGFLKWTQPEKDQLYSGKNIDMPQYKFIEKYFNNMQCETKGGSDWLPAILISGKNGIIQSKADYKDENRRVGNTIIVDVTLTCYIFQEQIRVEQNTIKNSIILDPIRNTFGEIAKFLGL
jgi:hypothetical protein